MYTFSAGHFSEKVLVWSHVSCLVLTLKVISGFEQLILALLYRITCVKKLVAFVEYLRMHICACRSWHFFLVYTLPCAEPCKKFLL